jgi:hypothetical protein
LEKSKCPLCGKEYSDVLKHLAITHEIKDMNDLRGAIEKVEEENRRKTEFRNYVEGLMKKMKEGTITAKNYRELVAQWSREHRRSEIEDGRTGTSYY